MFTLTIHQALHEKNQLKNLLPSCWGIHLECLSNQRWGKGNQTVLLGKRFHPAAAHYIISCNNLAKQVNPGSPEGSNQLQPGPWWSFHSAGALLHNIVCSKGNHWYFLKTSCRPTLWLRFSSQHPCCITLGREKALRCSERLRKGKGFRAFIHLSVVWDVVHSWYVKAVQQVMWTIGVELLLILQHCSTRRIGSNVAVWISTPRCYWRQMRTIYCALNTHHVTDDKKSFLSRLRNNSFFLNTFNVYTYIYPHFMSLI